MMGFDTLRVLPRTWRDGFKVKNGSIRVASVLGTPGMSPTPLVPKMWWHGHHGVGVVGPTGCPQEMSPADPKPHHRHNPPQKTQP